MGETAIPALQQDKFPGIMSPQPISRRSQIISSTFASPETAQETPPESFDSSPTTVHPTTPLNETTDPWEELSAGTAETSISADFSVLKGYNRIPIYERRAQWLAEQQIRREQVLRRTLPCGNAADFDPNAHLPFPITAQFLSSYGGGGGGKKMVHWNRECRDSGDTVVPQMGVYGEDGEYEGQASTIASTPVSERCESEVRPKVQEKEGGFRKPGLDRKTSGIPSFDSLFETMWDFDEPKTPITPLSGHQSAAFEGTVASSQLSESSCVIGSMHGSKATFGYFLGSLKGCVKGYSFALFAFGCLGLIMLQYRRPTTEFWIQAEHSYDDIHNASRCVAADFPTLLSIENSLERTLLSVAATAPSLASLLKQGEMAVSDLSTVVQHSDLDCRKTLSEQLFKFATRAGEVAGSIQAFESAIGRALNQIDSANIMILQDLTHLQRSHTPLLYRSLFRPLHPHQKHGLSTSYRALSRHLDSTMASLASDITKIIKSLAELSDQHAPIYTAIVREYTTIERAQSALWTRARGVDYRESKELLALVGTYEEKTRGYVERIGMEYARLRGEFNNLRAKLAEDSGRVMVGDGVKLSVQVDAVRGMVALKALREVNPKRAECLGGVRNGTARYAGLFKPTKTRSG